MVAAFALTYNSLVDLIQQYSNQQNNTQFTATIPTFVLFAQRRIAREIKILGLQEYVTSTFTATNGIIAKPSRWLQTIEMNLGAQAGAVYKTTITARGSFYQFPPTITGGTGTTYQSFIVNGELNQIGIVDGGSGNAAGPLALTVTPATEDDTGTGATATYESYVGNNTRKLLLPLAYEVARIYWPNALLVDEPKFYSDYDFNHWLIVPTPEAALPLEVGYFQIADLIDESHQTNWLTDNAPDLLLYACLLEAYPFLQNPEKQAIWQSMYDRASAGFLAEDAGRVAGRETVRLKAGAPA